MQCAVYQKICSCVTVQYAVYLQITKQSVCNDKKRNCDPDGSCPEWQPSGTVLSLMNGVWGWFILAEDSPTQVVQVALKIMYRGTTTVF